jgi:hypothetical protein
MGSSSPAAAFVNFAYAEFHSWLSFYFPLIDGACLKTERLRRVNPAATTPFAPLGFVTMDGVNEFIFN